MRFFFFFQAGDGIRDFHVTGVQTCALPIFTAIREGRWPRPSAKLARPTRQEPAAWAGIGPPPSLTVRHVDPEHDKPEESSASWFQPERTEPDRAPEPRVAGS